MLRCSLVKGGGEGGGVCVPDTRTRSMHVKHSPRTQRRPQRQRQSEGGGDKKGHLDSKYSKKVYIFIFFDNDMVRSGRILTMSYLRIKLVV